ncbi:MAG TPA: DUF3179 domain-containing (seleno)protein [Chitinophagaceae bacterium]|nr:DUF3179 domain-containing (seleno)protein [Chitinophagaceae bacterium]
MKKLLIPLGLLLLFAAEILRVYFIMPFPGSQRNNTISIAYFLHKYIFFIRLFALLMVGYGAYLSFPRWKNWKKVVFIFGMLLYAGIFYMVNFKFLADKMFLQPKNKVMATAGVNKIGEDKLVVGVTINNESKAYPIEIIGYHHQVQDTIGGKPVIITYCTVCRTGRVFSPVVNGKEESFRLVGMDHFNAMFEDKTTKSWWRQATGEAVTGKMKGQKLTELPSQQMRLGAWIRSNPNSLVMQPDPAFADRYKELVGFDIGTIKSGLEKRDPGSWKFKSWVVGIQHNKTEKAYDWNDLLSKKLINDSLTGLPVVIVVEPDNASFHVWDRTVEVQALFQRISQTLVFTTDSLGMKDLTTGSKWNFEGLAIDGSLKGTQLRTVQAHQEFWHSWQSFHPATTTYK